ncbi:MAG: methylated-DNA--[protein]-cysteine S-methyltransferase [Actinomycetota bacterium]
MLTTDELQSTVMSSPVGTLRLTASSTGLVSIEVVRSVKEDPSVPTGAPRTILTRTRRQLEEYFAGRRRTFDVPLDLRGTEFQVAAWKAMSKSPYGRTISYGQQAKSIGKPTACRAVGSANGKNPIPIIVPCHRVLASDGSLGGYSLGLTMKRRLLSLEGVSVAG